MRGQRADYAFSNYDRFKRLTKFEREAQDFNKSNFSLIDIHDKIYTNPRKHPAFNK